MPSLTTTSGDCPVGNEWQDISTAPKDGTRVIVGVWVHDAFDDETFWADWIESYSEFKPHWGEDDTNGDEPTHWMPLPPPPNTGGLSDG